MSTTQPKKSGFVNPMALRQELAESTGAQPLHLEPEVPQEPLNVLELLPQPEAPKSSRKGASRASEPMPWGNCHPKVKIHFGLRIPEKLHKQFEYAANHTLGDSMQTFALRALEEAVYRRLKDLGVLV